MSWILEITGGNADVAENMGIVKRAIRKLMDGQELKIDKAKKDSPQRAQSTQRGLGMGKR